MCVCVCVCMRETELITTCIAHYGYGLAGLQQGEQLRYAVFVVRVVRDELLMRQRKVPKQLGRMTVCIHKYKYDII